MSRTAFPLLTGLMTGLIVITVIAPAAPPHSSKGKRPSTLALVTVGHTLFLSNCSPCHGADANGDDGPDLHHKNLPDTFVAAAVKK